MESVLTLKTWITQVEGEMTRRLYHCNSEITAQLNYLIKIYLYLYNPVFYFSMVQIGISLKAAGLVSFDCAKLCLMNFMKDLLEFCVKL